MDIWAKKSKYALNMHRNTSLLKLLILEWSSSTEHQTDILALFCMTKTREEPHAFIIMRKTDLWSNSWKCISWASNKMNSGNSDSHCWLSLHILKMHTHAHTHTHTQTNKQKLSYNASHLNSCNNADRASARVNTVRHVGLGVLESGCDKDFLGGIRGGQSRAASEMPSVPSAGEKERFLDQQADVWSPSLWEMVEWGDLRFVFKKLDLGSTSSWVKKKGLSWRASVTN